MEKKETIEWIDDLLHSGDIDYNEKIYLLKLRNIYNKSFTIGDVDEIEKKLYKNRKPKEKFYFEKNRILRYMEKYGRDGDANFLSDLKFIKTKEKMLSLINDNDDDTYSELLQDLVKLEIDLGIDIGLFKEFRKFVIRYLNDIDNTKITNKI